LSLEQLVTLGTPLRSVKDEIAIIERREEITGPDSISRARRGRANEAFERGHDRPLHLSLQYRFCCYAMLPLCESETQSQRNGTDCGELQSRAVGAEQRRLRLPNPIDHSTGKQSVCPKLQPDHWTKQRRDGLGKSQRFFVKSATRMPLERNCPDATVHTVG